MISIKQINEKDIDLCYELDLNTISLWSKRQWNREFKKDGIKVFGLLVSNFVVGICVFHVVLDEAQINFFAVLDLLTLVQKQEQIDCFQVKIFHISFFENFHLHQQNFYY